MKIRTKKSSQSRHSREGGNPPAKQGRSPIKSGMTRVVKIDIIGYDSGWGCRDFGCQDGPVQAKFPVIAKALEKLGHDVNIPAPLELKKLGRRKDFKTKQDTLPLVIESTKRLISQIKKSKRLPVVIGGDHASALGTWPALSQCKKAHGKFGLIWLDAHLDAHTPITAHEGKWGGWWHGMPVACVTGHGHKDILKLIGKKATIAPKNLTMIGIRSFEEGEAEFVKKSKIKTFFMKDVKKAGFQKTYDTALKRALDRTRVFGLSIDLDGFDPKDAPGVGTGETGGLRAKEVLKSIRGVGLHPKFAGLEIAEFNPHNDINGITTKLIQDIIISVFSHP